MLALQYKFVYDKKIIITFYYLSGLKKEDSQIVHIVFVW